MGITLVSRQDAIDWIDKNQLGRRNLNPDQMSLIRARIRERRKFPVGGDRGHQRSGGENRQMHQTLHETAKELGVGTKTLQEDVQFARAVEAQPEVKEKIEQGARVGLRSLLGTVFVPTSTRARARGGDEKLPKKREVTGCGASRPRAWGFGSTGVKMTPVVLR